MLLMCCRCHCCCSVLECLMRERNGARNWHLQLAKYWFASSVKQQTVNTHTHTHKSTLHSTPKANPSRSLLYNLLRPNRKHLIIWGVDYMLCRAISSRKSTSSQASHHLPSKTSKCCGTAGVNVVCYTACRNICLMGSLVMRYASHHMLEIYEHQHIHK